MKKYEFTGVTKTEMYDGKEILLKQIRAIRDITTHGIKSGTIGGWLSEDAVLTQEGDSWVSGHSYIIGESEIAGNVFIDQSNVYDSFVEGDAKVKSSHIFSSILRKTDFEKVDNCVLRNVNCVDGTLKMTDSYVENVKVIESKLAFKESNVLSLGSVPFVAMLEGDIFIAKKSNVYIKTEHPDHARIHKMTVMKNVNVNKERPLTMLAAFETFLWENLSLADVQFHYGDIRPSANLGDSVLSGTNEVKLTLEGLHVQSQNSVIQGEVEVRGDIGLRDTTIQDHASVINRGEGKLYLTNVKVMEMASIDKRMQKFIKLENSVYGADDILYLN